MKKFISSVVILFAACAAVLFLVSCAEMEATNTKSLLSAAGFHTVTPTTPLQKEVYGHLTAYRVQRVSMKGKTIYAFKDEGAGMILIGASAGTAPGAIAECGGKLIAAFRSLADEFV